jgi:hypothetical protein
LRPYPLASSPPPPPVKGSATEADLIARRKTLYEARHPETKAGPVRAAGMNRALGHDVDASFAPTFAEATARATGKPERSIQRAATRGKRLGFNRDRANLVASTAKLLISARRMGGGVAPNASNVAAVLAATWP